MTNDEAAGMMAELSRHFGVPVMPLTKYCDALIAWQNAIHDRAQRLKCEMYPWIEGPYTDQATRAAYDLYKTEREKYSSHAHSNEDRWSQVNDLIRMELEAESVDSVFLRIRKSNLLARMLYGGEALRETPCPDHKGRWSGVDWDGTACQHGCELTGWLPAKPTVVEIHGLGGECLGKVST